MAAFGTYLRDLNYKKSHIFLIILVIVGVFVAGGMCCLLESAPLNLFTPATLQNYYEPYGYVAHAGTLCLGKYTPLNGSQLLNLLNEYKDAYIITDTKYSHIAILKTLVAEAEKKYPSVLDRIIPHIAGAYDLRQLRRIYPFQYYMLALYRSSMTDDQVIKFVKDNHISVVMMWWDSRYTDEFKEKLRRAGAVTYVHSLRDPKKIASFREQGVGIYIDCAFSE